MKSRAAARFETIRHRVHDWIHTFDRINLSSTLTGWEVISELGTSVDRIVVCESTCPSQSLPLDELVLQIHVYQPSDTNSFEEFSNGAGSKDEEDDTMAASVCELPNLSWEGLWDSLIYADDIKMKLLDYIHATLIFSDADVNCEYDMFNGTRSFILLPQLILFHGIASCYCMDHREQERHHYVEHLRRSSPSAYPIGMLVFNSTPCPFSLSTVTPMPDYLR